MKDQTSAPEIPVSAGHPTEAPGSQVLDPRITAFSLADLAMAFVENGLCPRISEPGGRCLTAADVSAWQGRLSTAGIGAGEVVIVSAEATVETAAVFLALWISGCAVCPVESGMPEASLAQIRSQSGAAALVTPEGGITPLPETRRPPAVALSAPLRVTGCDRALMIFTSGSSGTPKGVLLSHHNVMSALRAICGYLELTPDDTILVLPPLFFDYGLYQLLFALFGGCRVVLPGAAKGALQLARAIAETRPTVLPVVPALATALPRVLEALGRQVPEIRLITNTGGHLSESSIAQLHGAFPAASFMAMYGLTECKRALYYPRGVKAAHPGSVGGPMPGLEVALRDTEGEESVLAPADPGATGELMVRGSSVMQGYVGGGAQGGAQLFEGRWRGDNWMSTGDLMRRDDEDNHYFRGRRKLLIKQAGYCLNPRDIEAVAEEDAAVATAIVVGRVEDSGDESAVMFVEAVRNGAATHGAGTDGAGDGDAGAGGALDLVALKRRLAARLAHSQMPRAFEPIVDWPMTANGKIDRKALTERATRHERGAA